MDIMLLCGSDACGRGPLSEEGRAGVKNLNFVGIMNFEKQAERCLVIGPDGFGFPSFTLCLAKLC